MVFYHNNNKFASLWSLTYIVKLLDKAPVL